MRYKNQYYRVVEGEEMLRGGREGLPRDGGRDRVSWHFSGALLSGNNISEHPVSHILFLLTGMGILQ